MTPHTPSETEARQALRNLQELASLHSAEAGEDAHKLTVYVDSIQSQCSTLQREKGEILFALGYGWQDLGEVKSTATVKDGHPFSRSDCYSFCNTIAYVGKQNYERFKFCPLCEVKLSFAHIPPTYPV